MDYETQYRTNPKACGDPFPEVVEFFTVYSKNEASVLDLGCGQGRDALMVARFGHRVVGVDCSATGVSQMVAAAQNERVSIEGVVTDLRNFVPESRHNVVILDRVLHMFKLEAEKLSVLAMATEAVQDHGHLLIVETPSNLPLVDSFLGNPRHWCPVLKRKGFRFYRHQGNAA